MSVSKANNELKESMTQSVYAEGGGGGRDYCSDGRRLSPLSTASNSPVSSSARSVTMVTGFSGEKQETHSSRDGDRMADEMRSSATSRSEERNDSSSSSAGAEMVGFLFAVLLSNQDRHFLPPHLREMENRQVRVVGNKVELGLWNPAEGMRLRPLEEVKRSLRAVEGQEEGEGKGEGEKNDMEEREGCCEGLSLAAQWLANELEPEDTAVTAGCGRFSSLSEMLKDKGSSGWIASAPCCISRRAAEELEFKCVITPKEDSRRGGGDEEEGMVVWERLGPDVFANRKLTAQLLQRSCGVNENATTPDGSMSHDRQLLAPVLPSSSPVGATGMSRDLTTTPTLQPTADGIVFVIAAQFGHPQLVAVEKILVSAGDLATPTQIGDLSSKPAEVASSLTHERECPNKAITTSATANQATGAAAKISPKQSSQNTAKTTQDCCLLSAEAEEEGRDKESTGREEERSIVMKSSSPVSKTATTDDTLLSATTTAESGCNRAKGDEGAEECESETEGCFEYDATNLGRRGESRKSQRGSRKRSKAGLRRRMPESAKGPCGTAAESKQKSGNAVSYGGKVAVCGALLFLAIWLISSLVHHSII